MQMSMKKLRYYFRVLVLVCGLVSLLSGCESGWQGETDNPQTLLIYMAGNNNLSSYAYMNYSDLNGGYIPKWCQPGKGDVLLVYMHTADTLPRLVRLFVNNKGHVSSELIREYPDQNSLDPKVMKKVLTEVAESYPAQENGLILWSHGSGWLPRGYYDDPSDFESQAGASCASTAEAFPPLSEDPYRDWFKSMGPDSKIEVDIQDLEQALPIHYDYLIFDACLMGGVEVAYQLRNKADYIIASVAEILAQGFPYRKIVSPLLAGGSADLGRVASIFFDHYDSQAGSYRAATIALVQTAPLEALADAVKTVFANHREELANFDRRRVQGFYRNKRSFFFDLEDFIRQLATDAEYAAFETALADCVLYEAATESFLMDYSYGFEIRTHCGLSTYIPAAGENYLQDFYRTLDWNDRVQLVVSENE